MSNFDIPNLDVAAIPEHVGIIHKHWKIITVGLLIGITIFTLWFLQVQPLYELLNPIMLPAINGLTVLVIAAQDLAVKFVEAFMANPLQIGGTILASSTAVVTLVSKIRADRRAAEVEASSRTAVSEAQKKVISMGTEYTAMQKKVEGLQAKLDAAKDNNELFETQQVATRQAEELRSAREQIATLEGLVKDLKVTEKVVYK